MHPSGRSSATPPPKKKKKKEKKERKKERKKEKKRKHKCACTHTNIYRVILLSTKPKFNQSDNSQEKYVACRTGQ